MLPTNYPPPQILGGWAPSSTCHQRDLQIVCFLATKEGLEKRRDKQVICVCFKNSLAMNVYLVTVYIFVKPI